MDECAAEGDSMLTHTREELQALFLDMTGRTAEDSGILSIEQYGEDLIVATARFDESHLRPGGVIAGPNLFMVVDSMGYLVTMSRAPKGSNGFTSAISMQFLRRSASRRAAAQVRQARFRRGHRPLQRRVGRADRSRRGDLRTAVPAAVISWGSAPATAGR
jgi:acyl-coenzyme A thioesterase PaaI-like protein